VLAASYLWPNECQPFSVTNGEGWVEKEATHFIPLLHLERKAENPFSVETNYYILFLLKEKDVGIRDTPE